MLTVSKPAAPIKAVRVPQSDVDAAASVAAPRLSSGGCSRRFAAMGAAILEKLCRSGGMTVRSRRTTPYILDTARGKVAVSVMVSAISGDPSSKHMIVPMTSLHPPPGVDLHVIVCSFVSKLERVREKNGGLNVKLAGWATSEEVAAHANENTRVNTCLRVAAVPVSELHPIQTLRHYLSPKKKGERKCENSSSDSRPPQPSADATARSSTRT